MKLALPLSLIVVAATSLACSSDDENEPRPSGGTAGTGTGNAGTGGTGGGTGGTGGGAGGAGGAPAQNFTYGATFSITADGNVVDSEGTSAVNGGTFYTESTNMTVPGVEAHRDGALCFSGSTAVVVNDNYDDYWGAELGLNLKLIPDPAAPPPAADAGADAGAAVPLIPDPAGWPYGDVIGFSFKLVGNDAAAADRGVPPSRIRFKALPVGSVGANDNYCYNLVASADGQTVNVLFSDITFECWAPGNLGLDGDMINRIDPGPPPLPTSVANPRALQNISWQIASDTPTNGVPAPIAFDFCIEELKPITGM